MTQVTPPGWYPDPGQTHEGPRTERWWDGGAWTQQTRSEGGAAPGWGPPFPPGVPPRKPPRRGLRTAVGAGVTLVVLACIGMGAYALSSDDGKADHGDEAASAPPSPSPDRSGPPRGGGSGGEGGGEGGIPAEKGFATDVASGVSLPVPDGWDGKSGMVGSGVTIGTYPCPGDASSTCVRGGAFSQPAAALDLDGMTPRQAAEKDIAKNAKESYGGEVYGEITSHDELAAKAVTVAGGQGYLVRWKVVTEKGDDGFVESLAFPSPADPKVVVVVRFGIDDSAKAPDVSVMDEITRGIRKADATGGGGGAGQDA